MSELLAFILSHEEAFRRYHFWYSPGQIAYQTNSRSSRGRLSSLYSDFRLQLNTNPDGYYANISAWKKALTDAARAGVIPAQGAVNDLLTIRTGEELSRALASKEWGRPMALGAVIVSTMDSMRTPFDLLTFWTARCCGKERDGSSERLPDL